MKKIFVLFVAVLITIQMNGQDIASDGMDPLAYLEVGKKYSQDAIKRIFSDVEYKEDDHFLSTLGERTIYYDELFPVDDKGLKTAHISANFRNDILSQICVEYLFNDGFTKDDYASIKEHIKSSDGIKQCEIPEQIKKLWSDDFKFETWRDKKEPTKYIYIISLKDDNKTEFGGFYLVYTLLDDSFEALSNIRIQDTFFGLTLGKTYAENQVKQALDKKGEYFEAYNEGKAKTYTLRNVWIGGYKWDYINMVFTDKNAFCNIELVFSIYYYPDYSKEKNEAVLRFDSVLENLSDKYGYRKVELDENNESYVFYIGNNGIDCSLSNRVGESKGGQKRRYVILSYADLKLNHSLLEQSRDEF